MAPPRVTQEEWQRRAKAAGYALLHPVEDYGAKVPVRCLACEREADVWPTAIAQGQGCRACAYAGRRSPAQDAGRRSPAQDAPGGKICTLCEEWKPIAEFHRRTRTWDGRQNRCKACATAKAAEWYHDNAERAKAQRQEHYARNAQRIAAERREAKFGITAEQHAAMFAEQGGCCAICGRHESEFQHPLNVDHDHTTGRIRGLLCTTCNRGLGVLGDDLASLTRAVEYLREHEANPDRFPGQAKPGPRRAA